MLASHRILFSVVAALLLAAVAPLAAAAHSPDAEVAYASYWGGMGAEGCEPTVGGGGSIYLTCGTDSPNLPTVGRGSRPHQGQEDGYIVKLDPTGTRIIYATYLGSPGHDEIDSAAVDAAGNLYVTGFAADGYPTTPGALEPSFNGAADCCDGLFGDAFITKLSPDGSQLVYSTFLGGSGADRTNSIALGRDGSVTVAGFTSSPDFPTTTRAGQASFGGGTATFEVVPADAFATTLNPSGSRLIYSTFLGGSGDDIAQGVVLDRHGNAYLVGLTDSPDFPTTPGALKPFYGTPRPIVNGFVTKLTTGGRTVWSTYLGGQTRDSAWGIDVDADQDVYVSGSTIGGFPVTRGATQPAFAGVRDWFVAKLDHSGAQLDWATYLGGSDRDGLSPTVRIDRLGQVNVVGPTASTDFPTTRGAFQKTNAGDLDVAVVQLSNRGRLLFSSYYGGSGEDDTTGVPPALDRQGNIYFSGTTSSPDLPVTARAIAPTFGGGDIDSMVVKVDVQR